MSDRQEPKGSQPGSRIVGGPAGGADAGDDANATDAAAQLAADNNIDLASITGTGVDGRVTKADVQAAIDAKG